MQGTSLGANATGADTFGVVVICAGASCADAFVCRHVVCVCVGCGHFECGVFPISPACCIVRYAYMSKDYVVLYASSSRHALVPPECDAHAHV